MINGYSEPIKAYFNISPAKGETTATPFGQNVDYDREMTTHEMKTQINEFTRLWIGRSTDEPYNYIVKKVAESINCIRYAIKRVDVS